MKGDPGPYMEMNGPHVWVPRTVPYLEARQIAKQSDQEQYGCRLVYRGKDEDAELLGFTRDCPCDEVCEDRERDEYGYLTDNIETPCRVPAWKFEWVERTR